MKGIRSPWAQPPPVPDDPLEGARAGKQPVRIHGRAYSFFVELPVRLPEERAKPLALSVLGDALGALERDYAAVAEELTTQKLGLDTRPIGTCVTLPLGARSLYAVASSTDEGLALAMAVDRLAIAITRLCVRHPEARATLKSHYTTIVRET